MSHGVRIRGRALLGAALLALASSRAQAKPPEAAPSCGQHGRVAFDASATLADAAGHPIARFSGGESAVTFISPPVAGSDLSKIETGTGRGSFRLLGFVKAGDLRLYTTSNVPIVNGHVWLGPGTRVVAAASSAGKVRLDKQLTRPFSQRFSANVECSALTFNPPTPPPFSPPNAARSFVMKGAELELYAALPPVGAPILTLVRAPDIEGVTFFSNEQRGGFVHVQYHGEVNVDAWAKAEQLTPSPRGETFDVPQSSYSLTSPPKLDLPILPPIVKTSREVPLRSAPRDAEPAIGVIEPDTEVFVLEVGSGWAKVLPKSLHVLPYGERAFWVKAGDLPPVPQPDVAPEAGDLRVTSTSGSACTRPPRVFLDELSVSGSQPPEVVAHTLRQRFGICRACYERALANAPKLAGTVKVSFSIGSDGRVSSVVDAGSKLRDPEMVACVLRVIGEMTFPRPEDRSVAVVAALHFSQPRSTYH